MKTHIFNAAKFLTATALISGGIALSVPAAAITTHTDIVTTTIDIRDLETDRGVAKIYKTLVRRADSACKTPGSKSVSMRQAEDVCAENLLIDFVQDVDDVRLTNYHEKMQS